MKNYNSVITCRQGQIYWIGIGWQLLNAKIGMIHQDMYVGDSTGSEAVTLQYCFLTKDWHNLAARSDICFV